MMAIAAKSQSTCVMPPTFSARNAAGSVERIIPRMGMYEQTKTIIASRAMDGRPRSMKTTVERSALTMATTLCASNARPSMIPNACRLGVISR
jgi:hypothetical protein